MSFWTGTEVNPVSAEKRIALVTGANRGLGFELCRQLAAQDITVLLGARSADSGEKAANELRNQDKDVHFIQLDMTDDAGIVSATSHIAEQFGRLDILVNNAAILTDMNQQPTEVSDGTLKANFAVNFFGPWKLTRELAPLIKASSGRVLNMSTQVARLSQLADPESPLKDDICPAYQASKVALNAMTVLFAKEFREHGASVNSVCPGWVLTDMGHEDLPDYGDAARPMTSKEAVAAYLWLLAPDDDVPTGGFYTGHERVEW
jgi:NAD(P)-dependent dehydrogenase (short-subunit alcohol dehydrogenase family)